MKKIPVVRCTILFTALCLLPATYLTSAGAQPNCPFEPGQPPLCQQLATSQCITPQGPNDFCLPTKLRFNPAVPGALEAIDCACQEFGGECGPIFINGDLIRCPGQCLVPPHNPGDTCQLIVDGVPTGASDGIWSTFPPGTEFECGCFGDEPIGACCDEAGNCVVVPPSQCNGIYLGDGTVCGGTGSCCFDADGDGIAESCQVVDIVCCQQVFGGTPLAGATCLQQIPCCLPNGQCVIADEACCLDQGGSFALQGACLGDNNGNMIDDGCEDIVLECGPSTDGTHCLQAPCPVPGQECLPRCLRRFSDGTTVVDQCECISPNECHLEIDPATGAFFCVGACPPGQVCQTTTTPQADGSILICCECVPDTGLICPLPSNNILCEPLLTIDCQTTNPDTACYPRRLTVAGQGMVVAEECQCFGQGDPCGAIDYIGTLARCLGGCPIPPNNPGDQCVIHLNGVSTGQLSVDTANLPPDTTITCDCAGQEEDGACCDENGVCVIVPASQCTGVFAGPGTTCIGLGACCYDADGDNLVDSCTVVDGVCCDVLYNGTFQGVNTNCLGKGACCFNVGGIAGQCTVIDRICCDDLGGTFLGIGTICLGDANGDGADDACVPFDCQPDPNGPFCLPTTCPNPGEECLPRCVIIRDDGTVDVDVCDCISPNECHIEFDANNQPICVGSCPPGFTCEREVIPTPLGTRICCRCRPDPPDCQPTMDRQDCEPFVCPDPAEFCQPRCVRFGPNGYEILDCDCRGQDECHVEFLAGAEPHCVGNCPPGEVCIENVIVLADGTIEICCDCAAVACDCLGDINGDNVRNGLDIAGFVRCLLGNPLPGDNCACADLDGDGSATLADIPLFIEFMFTKIPCEKEHTCPPEDLLIDLTTGVDDNGNILPLNVPDDTWQVISEPPPLGVLPRSAVTIPSNPAWNTIPGTRWISANGTGPNGEYIYEHCFCLDKRFSNASLALLTRCDDAGEVFLNGNFIGTLGNFNAAAPAFVGTNNQAFFQPGINCIQVVVRNLGGVVTGFNLQGSIRAINGQCCCEPEDFNNNADSGVDDAGGLIPTGNDDDDWVVTVDPSGGFTPRQATVINPNPAWLTIPGTKWIAASYTGPNGAYHYEYCFCLEKWFEDAEISLDLRADDRADVFFNGNLVGSTPALYAFNTPLPTHVSVTNQSLFRVGENCIEIVVRNTHGVVTGLNVAVDITARNGLCCDEREECGPNNAGTGCVPVTCDDPNDSCVPVCMRVGPNGSLTVIDCDCRGPNECRVEVEEPGIPPYCSGACPPGQVCEERIVQYPDGSYDICCDCVENPPRGACCFSVGGCAILTQADCEQQGGVYLGDNSNCLGVQACCLQNGACIATDALCCEVVYGGLPQGPGSACLGDNDGDGFDDLCVPPPPGCRPIPGTPICEMTPCPLQGQKCQPKCVRVEPGTNFVIEVLECDCVMVDECHIVIDFATNEYRCVGGCPLFGQECRTTVTTLADGTEKVCCECVDAPPELACCNLDDGLCVDLAPGTTACPPGYTLVPGPCGNAVACCFADGSCIDTFQACCQEMGGMPQAAGVSCSDAPCGPPDCGPVPGTTHCRPVLCPIPGQECLPRCVRVEPGTNFVLEVLDCECVHYTQCHMEIDSLTNTYSCFGGCPQGATCTTTVTPLADGTERVCCECVDLPPPDVSCCNPTTGDCIDLPPGVLTCPTGYNLVPGPCGPVVACCYLDGTCEELNVACCESSKGIPLPVGVTCASGECGPNCGPVPGTLQCRNVICPTPDARCEPRCVRVEGATGIVLEVLDCECVSPNECHIRIDPATGVYECVGACPPGQICRTTVIDLGDGTQQVCCECIDDPPPPYSCCNFQNGQCLDLAPGTFTCPAGFSLVPGPCGNAVACCFPDGTCIDTFEACCAEAGGMSQGAGSNCNFVICQPPVVCAPIPGALSCQDAACPAPQICQPKCVRVEPGTGFALEVVDCECTGPDECHLEIDATGRAICVGSCPAGFICRTRVTVNPDGTETLCCECVPEAPTQCPPSANGGDRCIPILGPNDCIFSGTPSQCVPVLVIANDPTVGGPLVESCTCVGPNECGAIEFVTDTLIRCSGGCPPGQNCTFSINGNPTGEFELETQGFQPGTSFTCGCNQ